ncbi:hypothetical protein Pelo_18764 [Pelomyxa schiedti]|nr:hypothetical protein Pelo_18764 [Pelomyxa schiedti]
MMNGVPVSSRGVGVKRTVPLGGLGARFPPFDGPCGDEIVFVGNTSWGDGPKAPLISFVDLEKSVAAGVTVKARESRPIPHPTPFDLVWSSPDTILTLHSDATGYQVFNTVTRQQVRAFPSRTYDLATVSNNGHIVWVRKDLAMCEVYSASDMMMSKPSWRYPRDPLNWDCCGSSSNEIYAVKIQADDELTRFCFGFDPVVMLWI